MKNTNHHIKCERENYQDMLDGIKTFDVRKDDRYYRVGDLVWLEETIDGEKTGRQMSPKEIVYKFDGGIYGIERGFCVLQLANPKDQ